MPRKACKTGTSGIHKTGQNSTSIIKKYLILFCFERIIQSAKKDLLLFLMRYLPWNQKTKLKNWIFYTALSGTNCLCMHFLYNFEAAIFRSTGDTKVSLQSLAFAGVLNVLLNLLFVIVFKMSVNSVAIATVVYNLTSSLILLILASGKFLLSLFNSNPQVIEIGYTRLLIIFSAYTFSMLYEVMSGYLRGFGISFVPAILTTIGVCGVSEITFTTVFLSMPISIGLEM